MKIDGSVGWDFLLKLCLVRSDTKQSTLLRLFRKLILSVKQICSVKFDFKPETLCRRNNGTLSWYKTIQSSFSSLSGSGLGTVAQFQSCFAVNEYYNVNQFRFS